MNKKIVCFALASGITAFVLSSCSPELATTKYGTEEQQWKDYIQGCYNTWTPPRAPAPNSENVNITESDSSIVESAPMATSDLVMPPPTSSTMVISTESTPVSAVTSTPSSYVVKKGDTLWSVSQQVYGNGKYWKKIYDANKAKLPKSNSLKEGMVLNIPAK